MILLDRLNIIFIVAITINISERIFTNIVVLRKNRWGNFDELQVENNKSADKPGRMGNPDGPYAN